MKIRHDFALENGEIKTYIYINLDDSYEFTKDFFEKNSKGSFVSKLKEYIKTFLGGISSDKAMLIINGVVVGSMSLGLFLGAYDKTISSETCEMLSGDSSLVMAEESINNEDILDKNVKEVSIDIARENVEDLSDISVSSINVQKPNNKSDEKKSTNNINSNNVSNNHMESSNTNVKKDQIALNTSNLNETSKLEENSSNKNIVNNEKPIATPNEQIQAPAPAIVPEPTPAPEPEPQPEPEVPVPAGIMVTLNTGGSVINIELEEYIVGVVAAEMPASFNQEALKAQAVAARTYTMNKVSRGKTLVNSTSDQVYKSVDQMRNDWGGSFDYYYNKVQSAVYATKGQVLMYGGNYIDALYHSISSGKTELPVYIWGSAYPYLVSVDSSWDKNVKNYEVTKSFDYGTISNKLGFTVNEETHIEILSYTESGRVNQIKIGDSVLTGVQVRTKLGLRSTDFNIDKIAGGLNITTRGYGHGVGMSQYGANEAAKQGYSYIGILQHYYQGAYIAYV